MYLSTQHLCKLFLASGAAVTFLAAPASAIAIDPVNPLSGFSTAYNCDTTDITSYTFCIGMVDDTGINPAKNDSAAALNGSEFFGFSDWMELTKDDTPGGSYTSAALSLSYDASANSGTYQITDTTKGSYALVIKASSGFSAYLLTSLTGDFGNGGVHNNGGNPDISHITLYGRGMPSATVPLPAGALLLGTALAGFACVRRRKLG